MLRFNLQSSHLHHGLDPHHFNAGRPLPQVSLAMELAVPFTAVAFASFDVPLLGPGQPLDRRPAVKPPGGYPVVIRWVGTRDDDGGEVFFVRSTRARDGKIQQQVNLPLNLIPRLQKHCCFFCWPSCH